MAALGLHGITIEAPPDPEIENILKLVLSIFQASLMQLQENRSPPQFAQKRLARGGGWRQQSSFPRSRTLGPSCSQQVPNALVALFDERRIFIRESQGCFQRGDFPWRHSFCGWTLASQSDTVSVCGVWTCMHG
jgi:hypothetical protein